MEFEPEIRLCLNIDPKKVTFADKDDLEGTYEIDVWNDVIEALTDGQLCDLWLGINEVVRSLISDL